MVSVAGSEPGLDRLIVRTHAGDDVVDASGLQAGAIQLTADGGLGGDILIGSAGADVLLGGDGDDVLIGGLGVDVLDGGTGSNIIIQD
jgi:Ca2+-binding RTX toxin-like protein